MKGIIKKILTTILLIQIICTSIIASNQAYGVSDLIPRNSTANVTQGLTNSANLIYNSSGTIGDPAELPEDLTLPVFPDDDDDDNAGSEIDGSSDSEAGLLEKSIDGVAGFLLLPVRILPLLTGKVLTWVMSIVAGNGFFGLLSVADILFNDLPITDINFFNLNSGDSTVDQIRRSVSVWYYSIRNISAIILLVIIVYVGLRMALSTIAEQKAKYKQMLIDWLVGFALLFVLHYIMVFIININNGLVDILKSTFIGENGKLSDATMSTMFWNGLNPINGFTEGVGSALCYVMLVGVTFLFLVTYIRRMVTIGFLIVIAPLVTVTYSIDKMGDSKSQALNTWIKEFSYNILIQPFQCVTYLALGQTAISILEEGYSIKAVVIAIAMLIFILTSEKIIKHIFHFQSKSMTDTLQGAIVGTTLMSLIGNKRGGKKASGSSSGNGGGDGSNKFTDNDMTTPTSNPQNVGQGGGNGSGNRSGGGAGASANSRRRSARHSTPLGNVAHKAGRAAKGIAVTGFKLGGIATGAMLGLGATGSADKGMIQGGMLSNGITTKFVDKKTKNSQRRSLARAYNDYADEIARQNPRFSPEQINEEVRKRALDLINDNIQGPLSDEDKALKEALKDLEKTYTKDGLSESEIKEQLSKDFDGIESGAISETSAPVRYMGKIKDKVSRVTPARRASRNSRWGFGNQNTNNPTGGQTGNPRGRTGRSGRGGSRGGTGRGGRGGSNPGGGSST